MQSPIETWPVAEMLLGEVFEVLFGNTLTPKVSTFMMQNLSKGGYSTYLGGFKFSMHSSEHLAFQTATLQETRTAQATQTGSACHLQATANLDFERR